MTIAESRPLISAAEQARRADAVRAARGSVELEGYVSRPLYEQIDNDYIAGRLTLAQYIERCKHAASAAN